MFLVILVTNFGHSSIFELFETPDLFDDYVVINHCQKSAENETSPHMLVYISCGEVDIWKHHGPIRNAV